MLAAVFRREGPARDLKTNTVLAAYLAGTAGFVNSGGFVMIGSFTSHVTGSIGRLASDVAEGHFAASVSALSLVLAFFLGSVVASLTLEPSKMAPVAARYGMALAAEAGLLALFVFVAGLSRATHPRILDAQAALLCAAMGMQNSLVTRLSGAVVRTTHLTGVVTDLGIETARWYRWQQARLLRGNGPASSSAPEPPAFGKIWLLCTIIASFVVGAAAGAILTYRASRWAMLLPAAAVGVASAFAFYQGSSLRRPSNYPAAR